MKEENNSDTPLLLFKYGGNAMVNESLEKEVLHNICDLQNAGYQVVIVHGGGPFIKDILKKVDIKTEFIEGHRKTTSEAMEYIEMALKGKVNTNLVNRINSFGSRAVGLSGIDGRTVLASRRVHKQMIDGEMVETDLGQVGDVDTVDPSLIKSLIKDNYIPVLACIASDREGVRYNINADMFAGHIAGALRATEFVVLTDVDGLLKDKDDPDSIIKKLELGQIKELLENGIIQGGMIPKIESCEIALNRGASAARIINGTAPEQIHAITKNEEVGTIIYQS